LYRARGHLALGDAARGEHTTAQRPDAAGADHGGDLGLDGRPGRQVDEGRERLAGRVTGARAHEPASGGVGPPYGAIQPEQEQGDRDLLEHGLQQPPLGVRPAVRLPRQLAGRAVIRVSQRRHGPIELGERRFQQGPKASAR
jgi:hypothetical protein